MTSHLNKVQIALLPIIMFTSLPILASDIVVEEGPEPNKGFAVSYYEQDLTFEVNGRKLKALLRTPERLTARPALLINLGGGRKNALESDSMRMVPDIFLAAGHRVISFDLPGHGNNSDTFGGGLASWAKKAKAGVDVFKEIRDTGKALIDFCIERKLTANDMIVISGVSRGGLAALHIMAEDPRVVAVSIQSSMTYIPALREFTGLENNPIIQRGNAESLIPKLANRPILVATGSADHRVSAEHCFTFYARLRSVSTTIKPELYTAPGASHKLGAGSYPFQTGDQVMASFLLRKCAERSKVQ